MVKYQEPDVAGSTDSQTKCTIIYLNITFHTEQPAIRMKKRFRKTRYSAIMLIEWPLWSGRS